MQATTGATSDVEVAVVDRAEYDAALEGLRDKVILVDFWATWCLPCLEQLPHSMKLAKRDGENGLAVVTVSLDDPESVATIGAVLERVGAGGLTNLVSQFGGSPQSAEAFEIDGGAIPHYKLYDRSGKLRQTFALDPTAARQFTPADIDAAVEELLAE
jgi:thiol-disulfide isomerase/thioredoxin